MTVSHELTANQKKWSFWSVFLLLYATTTNHFLIRLWLVMKSDNSHHYMKTSDDWFSGWAKKKLQITSQIQTCTKRRSWSLFGGLLPIWSTTAFSILMKLLHLRSLLNKLMSSSKNCNSCSRHESTERAQFVSETMPNLKLHNHYFKSWTNCATKFSSSAMFTRPLSNQLPVLQVSWQLFAGKTFSQPAWCIKCFPRVHQILRHGFLCCRNKQTYFSLSKMCWLQWFLFY